MQSSQSSNEKTDVLLSTSQMAERMGNFKELLGSIQSLDEKKQHLWLEIYENALVDRQNAYQNYIALITICKDKSSEHAVHGRTMATFLERMSKSNDQLLKLADLIAKTQQNDEEINENDLYDAIQKRSKGN